jgi:CheY-like chemotaxis protein
LPRATHKKEEPWPELETHSFRGRGETILVVEDDEIVRLAVTEGLHELGYQYKVAASAQTAIPLLKSDLPIDLLVADIGFPHMGGRQLAEIARQYRPDLKVLFVSGYANDASPGPDVLAPGMEWMAKPFALDALGAKVRAMIARWPPSDSSPGIAAERGLSPSVTPACLKRGSKRT